MNESADICAVAAKDRARVLWLLLLDLDESDRMEQISTWLEQTRDEPRAFRGLLQAKRRSQPVGATWCQILPGNVGVLWLPRVLADEPEDTRRQLLQAAQSIWTARQTRFIQAIMTDVSDLDESLLREASFEPLTKLDYMTCDLSRELPLNTLSVSYSIEKMSPDERPVLLELIEQTYEDTLDCPEVDEIRSLEDIVTGYEATGDSGLRHWYLLRAEGQLAGCLLLSRHGQGDFELVYVGLRKQFRGRGWGAELTRFAQRIATGMYASRIFLAVDHRNHPAQNIYRELGFKLFCQRNIWGWDREKLQRERRVA